MKKLFSICIMVALYSATFAQNGAFSITASPAENTRNGMNISWATGKGTTSAMVEVAPAKDSNWKKSTVKTLNGEYCATYDNQYSKKPDGKNFYEDVKINKYNAHITGLKRNTMYKYRIITESDTSSVHYFKTSGKNWEACIISDFHAYAPLYHRTKSAMDMIGTVEKYGQPIDWVLHLGDITAWGGCYSFWQSLYTEKPFHNYMWAGVNGNHDNMTRTNKGNTNKFFRDAAAYPLNGYEGELGVCYFFKYGDVLFIMLNNENMRSEEGLQKAQEWVKKVVAENPARYKVVCEHYQWFFGASGKDSQYPRWSKLFDELGITLALAGNNHIYASTHPLYDGKVVDPGRGTVYIQTTSSDNERGSACDLEKPVEHNGEKIKFRWTEGGPTISAMHMKVTRKKMVLTLLDRNGKVLETTEVFPIKK